MNRLIIIISFLLVAAACHSKQPGERFNSGQEASSSPLMPLPGAHQMGLYVNQLKGLKVALVVNQTSTVGPVHLVDTLLSRGIHIAKVFAPEHGFRGQAGAGERIKDGTDVQTGLPIVSLYGQTKKPTAAHLEGIDLVVFDIQDVGARFYTYISTMHYVMEACAENGVQFMVLDRPNPNGNYVDGPILEPAFKSFVGMHPIPIVHGLTVGELAQMINGEKWLKGGIQCPLEVIKNQHYSHQSTYHLPIKPSPNLPNTLSVWLYPSLCLFEGTPVSVGRGTLAPFLQIGYPGFPNGNHTFMPKSIPSMAKSPKHEGKACQGFNFQGTTTSRAFSLQYLLDFYKAYPKKEAFFTAFFNKLAGTDQLRKQIEQGLSEAEIKASWEPALANYMDMRKAYLLYDE